jgi:hypothetical protein
LILITRPAIEQHTVLATAGPLNKASINKQKEKLSLLTTLDQKLGATMA